MRLCIYEDNEYSRFEPVNYARPVFDLICGIATLREKILRAYPGVSYSLLCRDYIADIVKEGNPGIDVNAGISEDTLFINGRIIAPGNLSEIIPLNGESRVFKSGDVIIGARVTGSKIADMKKSNSRLPDFDDFPVENIDIRLADYSWNLIQYNAEELRNDFEFLLNVIGRHNNIRGRVYNGVHLVEKDNIFIADGAVIKPGVVIDASNGPVFIGENAVVGANAVIEGAVYVGENSVVKIAAALYQDVSVGKTCKVGGEVEDSIISPYSNKQHPGFLGHSYLGSWVNIGADTNCSDLKNNYSTVKVLNNGNLTDTKMQFLGLIMGDHSKSGINTMFNTGTIVGFSCSIFGAGFPDKYIPSFSWGGNEGIITYEVDKSIETAKRAMGRRKKELSSAEEEMFRTIFEITSNEREKRLSR